MSGDTSGGPTAEQVERWLDEVDASLRSLQDLLDPLLAEQTRLHERRHLLKELLASFGDRPHAGLHDPPSVGALESTRDRVHRQAVEIFEQAGRPLHTNDLHAEFLRRGYEVPGAGKPNNITVHLGGWSDVASPERGIYGLVEHIGEQTAKGVVKRRQKRKGR